MGHGVGAPDAGGQYDPMGQGDREKDPCGQYTDAGHAEHDAATLVPPAKGSHVPAGHGTCCAELLLSGHTYPGRQAPVGLTAPSRQKRPARGEERLGCT